MKTRSKEYHRPNLTTTHPKNSHQVLNQPTEQQENEQRDSTNENSLRDKLNVLYTDITSKPSYSAKVAEFLRQHDVHGLYRRIVKRKFPRRKVIARFPFELFMADLMEFPQYRYRNRGYRFALIVIDVFTKKLFTVPLKKKQKKKLPKHFKRYLKTLTNFQ